MGNPFLTPRSTSALVNAIPDKDMPWGTRILHLVSLVFLAGEGGGGRGEGGKEGSISSALWSRGSFSEQRLVIEPRGEEEGG